MRTIAKAAAAGAIAVAMSVPVAKAETITFHVRSNHPNTVSLEFYSQDRNAAWPGDGEVYILDDYNVKTFRLNCSGGETICYGAWVRNRSENYWGVGLDDANHCDSCCYTCDGGETRIINLQP